MKEIKATIISLYSGEEKTCYIKCTNEQDLKASQRILAELKRKMNLDYVYGRTFHNQLYVVRA